MRVDRIVAQDPSWIENTAEICGQVAVGCAETAETLQRAMECSKSLQKSHVEVEEITTRLEKDIADVAQATRKAISLSESAREKLETGGQTIELSMRGFADMISLINELGSHITGFAAAMDQVKRVSQTIDTIARTTNMLALNAAIEAEKAGEAGRTFGVVATEVKKLALDTRNAAVEITETVNSLADEASNFVCKVEHGVNNSGVAQHQFSGLQSLLHGVGDIVGAMNDQSEEIAESSDAINLNLGISQKVRASVAEANNKVHQRIKGAFDHIMVVEMQSNKMFDNLVHSGLSAQDMPFVEMAKKYAVEIEHITERALAGGLISQDNLFDTNYLLIEGSNPPRFRTGLNDWADANWRPLLDRVQRGTDAILSAVCSSKEGHLPTHISEFSRKPTGDIDHDTRYCRNGRLLLEGIDLAAKASEQDFMMGVYCHEGDGKTFETVRNVYVPLRFNGRRWGDFEIAYIL